MGFPLPQMLALVSLATLLPAGSDPAPAQEQAREQPDREEGFRSLFDGRSLDGWQGDPAFFRVEGGAIVAGRLEKRIAHNAFLSTEKEYSDFELRLQAKLTGEGRNAGVQFRTRRIPDHHEVSGYQYDIGSDNQGPIWGFLYDESRRRRFLATGDRERLRKVVKPDDWNDVVVRCEGPRVQLWVNGLRTVDYTEQDDRIERKGIIALQIHSGPPAEASYRALRIKEL